MSDRIPPDYKAIGNSKWRENANNVIAELNDGDKDLSQRIITYVNRFGYDRNDVETKIRTDEMFAVWFAKTPSRQGFHEKTAAEWLNRELGMKVTTLSKSGKNAMYVSSDGIIGIMDEKEQKPSKSLDFHWQSNGIDFYAMHKFTNESGGAQDNAHKEMMKILRNFQPAVNKSKVLFVIVDGDFYNAKRMDELRNLVRESDPKSFAVHIEEVPGIMKQY